MEQKLREADHKIRLREKELVDLQVGGIKCKIVIRHYTPYSFMARKIDVFAVTSRIR